MAARCLISLFLLFLATLAQTSQIDSALYRDYALVGVLPASSDPSRMNSYVAVIAKNVTTGAYYISSIFHLDEVTGFGSSVALGVAPTGNGSDTTTIAAVGSKDITGIINVFDVESDCSSDGCSAVFNYTSRESACQSGTTVVAGNHFIASSCSSNLLRQSKRAPAFSVCIINNLYGGNCSTMLDVSLNTTVCTRQKGGQMVVSSMDARDNMLVVGYCAVCTDTVGNSLSIVHHSGFAAYQVDTGGLLYLGTFANKDRSASCPVSMAINTQWVIMGYPDEGSVDFFYSDYPVLIPYQLNFTVALDTPPNFGANVDCDDNLAIASGRGQAGANVYGGAVIYQFSPTNGIQELDSTLPNLNYQTTFNYTFDVNIYNGTVLVVTQDSNLISWGFNTFSACPNGTEWDPVNLACSNCPLGLQKNSNNGNSFALCTPCEGGFYYNQSNCVGGIPCANDEFCPAGSSSPAHAIQGYIIQSDPDPEATDPLDFENTFYYSCYPYFILFLTAIVVIGVPLCCTWPRKTMAQKKLVMSLLNINFFYWPTGEEEGFFIIEDETERKPLLGSLNYERDPEQEEKIIERRKRHVNQFLGSLCTYFFLLSLILMIVFGVIFMSHGFNSSVTIDLQAIDVSTNPNTNNNMDDVYKYLVQIDSSPLLISIIVEGYNGDCIAREINFATSGCYNCRAFVTLNFNKQKQCVVQAYLPGQLDLDQISKFIFNFVKPDFYAQQVIYNVSTANLNTNTSALHGNAFFYGVVQPAPGGILRGNSTVEIMSILTYIADCESATPPKNDTKDKSDPLFVKGMVRVNNEYCVRNHGSFKGLASVSSVVQPVAANLYHDLNVSGFSLNIVLTKSPFYKNIQQSYYVSFGTILTITMLAAIDMYWFVEAITPWLGYLIYVIMALCLRVWKKTTRK